MAGGRVSPTATLLRNSRLFSLPPPLPRPSQAYKASATFESETATSLYPTHAAIETTRSSLPRGDWGLKHSLPSKSIGATSTPLVRIGDIESIDHITEFESAADLTMTLWKFQEFQLPITRPQSRPPKASSPRLLSPAMSVFESKLDNINSNEGDMTSERWKFKGPWLARETEGGFQEYIKKNISRQKIAFRNFLREQLAQKELTDRRERARDEGNDVAEDHLEVSDQRLDDYISYLRRNPKDLRELVEGFLDLPRATGYSDSYSSVAVSDVERNYAVSGPPATHPSAGLSYLRTASRIHNHPILGPQDIKRPVQGRFLTPQTTATGWKRSRALVGIGGVVADDSHARYQLQGQPSGSVRFDPDTTVGHKYWFHPQRATVANSGRIKLHLERTNKATLTLFNGAPDEKPDLNDAPVVPELSRTFPTFSDSWPQRSSPGTRGYGLENSTGPSQLSSNGRVRPLSPKDAYATSAILNLGRLNSY